MWNATVNGGCNGTCTQFALSAVNAEAELESWNMKAGPSHSLFFFFFLNNHGRLIHTTRICFDLRDA